jgi:hypothetical protein
MDRAAGGAPEEASGRRPGSGGRRPSLFADEALDRSFQRDGFVTFPLLRPSGLRRLRSLWERHDPGPLDGIWSNVQDGGGEANAEISATILSAFQESGAGRFAPARLPSATFLAKGTGPASDSKLHQDHNNVDESIAHSATLWVPLVDVAADNGALRVLPGSHDWFSTARAVTLPSAYFDLDDEVVALTELVEVPAGHAVAYAHALFHGSAPNRTASVRPAAVAGLLPAGVRHLHYWRPPGLEEGLVEELHVDGRFYLAGLADMAAGRLPESVEVGARVARRHRPISRAELLAAAAGVRSP